MRAWPIVLVLCVASACASQSAPPEALLSALGTAQALQHEADERQARGEIAESVATVRRVLDVPFPEGAAEREDVRLDAWGRIAALELDAEDDVRAEEAARSGLSESTRDSYFRARLYVVLGRVQQARASRLREAGDAAGAAVASDAALDALETSITINAAVLGIASEGAR